MSGIPRLSDLCFARNTFRVADGFAVSFVKLHGEDWIRAERHWVRIVSRVLETDAIAPSAKADEALYQAVHASVALLDRTDLRDRCPFCPSDAQGEAA
jgi:hypothetical protein